MKRSRLAASLALAATFCLNNGSVSRSANAQEPSTPSVQVVEVAAKKYEFDPSPIHVKQGNKIELKITAIDHTHGFRIEEYPDGVGKQGNPGLILSSAENCQKIEKGQTATVEFVAQTPGTYSFKCCVTCGLGHRHMSGDLIVDP